MPQFDGGSSHTATVVMTNPTSKAFNYNAMLYLGIDQVATAEASFSLAAGESRGIPFSVVMPAADGIYPVYLSVFSGGVLISHYQATEDVTVVGGPAVAFTFGDVSGGYFTCPLGGSTWKTIEFLSRITNNGGVAATHVITWMYTYVGTDDHIKYTFSLTLQPGESYDFYWNGPDHGPFNGCDPVLPPTRSFDFWLQDELGNRSGVL